MFLPPLTESSLAPGSVPTQTGDPRTRRADGGGGGRQGGASGDCASSPGPSLGPHRGTGQCWPMGRQGGHMAPFCSRSLLTEVPSLEGLTLFLIFLRIFFRAFTWTGRSDGESMVCRHLHGSSLQSLTLGRCQDRKSHFRVFNAGLFV